MMAGKVLYLVSLGQPFLTVRVITQPRPPTPPPPTRLRRLQKKRPSVEQPKADVQPRYKGSLVGPILWAEVENSGESPKGPTG